MGAKGLPRRRDGHHGAKAGAKKVALVRALSKLGYASRSQAYGLIRSGRVQVNGRVANDPALLVAPGLTRIEIGNVELEAAAWRCIALNKPRSVVTTRTDPEGRKTVYDLIADLDAHVVPVGRLDFATSGLILLTNDTRLADWLTNPVNEVARVYLVTVHGRVTPEEAVQLEAGVRDKDDDLRARAVAIRKASNRETLLVVELVEGKNREIRR